MPGFRIDSLQINVPRECLTAPLESALKAGHYEHQEAEALRRHMKDGDRMLDLGAGAGFLCALAARRLGADCAMGVEANPRMARVAQKNLERNGFASAVIRHGAIVSDAYTETKVRFRARQAFWAGAIDAAGPEAAEHHHVPALQLGDVLTLHRPSLVVMDIEGGEAALIGYPWPQTVRLVIIEIHTKLYPAQTVQALFDGFFAQGFTYMPWGSRGETLVFCRADP